MFNLFRKKEPVINITDKIWMTETAKFRGLLETWKNDKSIMFICWFDETYRRLSGYFSREIDQPVSIQTSREAGSVQPQGNSIVFAEHFPLSKKENELFLHLHLNAVAVHSSLDEPLFTRFGGEKIVPLMQKLGMAEIESIENSMISKAIKNAQQKIAKKLVFEQFANSQADWLLKNFPSEKK